MNSIWFDIKMILNKPNQGLMRLIIFNVAAFILLMAVKIVLLLSNHSIIFNSLVEHLALSSQPLIVLKEPWTVITYFFVHIELFHLFFNMLFLYWFGIILQDFIGSERLVKLYFWGGIAGAVAYLLLVNSFSYFIMKGPTFLNGASASVFAIVVAAATIRPTYQVRLFLLGDVQIKYVSAFYIVWSFIETIGTNSGGNIAHLGGALMGFLFGYFFIKPQNTNPSDRAEKVFVSVPYIQKKSQEYKIEREQEDVVEEELNRILDKISKSGYESLTKFEKRRLFKASQKNE